MLPKMASQRPEIKPKSKVAYIVSAFPMLTETFILNEILAMEQLGVAIEIYPLRSKREGVNHSEIGRLMKCTRYLPFLSIPVLFANWLFFSRRPLAYLKTLAEVFKGTFP